MPTGVNYRLIEGLESTLTFAKNLERQFGVYADLRDVSLSEPVPEDFFTKNPYAAQLDQLQKVYDLHKNMTDDQWIELARNQEQDQLRKSNQSLQEELDKIEDIHTRLPKLRIQMQKVKSWDAGTEYIHYRSLLLRQLSEAIDELQEQSETLRIDQLEDDDESFHKLVETYHKELQKTKIIPIDPVQLRTSTLKNDASNIKTSQALFDSTNQEHQKSKEWVDRLNNQLDDLLGEEDA
jgi:hypothetical protein